MNHTDRRVTLSLPQSSATPPMPPVKKPMVAKGHDAILKGFQDRSARITIIAISGETYAGTVVARDRWTITIRDKDNTSVTIYKHAIESFANVVGA